MEVFSRITLDSCGFPVSLWAIVGENGATWYFGRDKVFYPDNNFVITGTYEEVVTVFDNWQTKLFERPWTKEFFGPLCEFLTCVPDRLKNVQRLVLEGL